MIFRVGEDPCALIVNPVVDRPFGTRLALIVRGSVPIAIGLRRMTGGGPADALRTLTDVIEPARGYSRNANNSGVVVAKVRTSC